MMSARINDLDEFPSTSLEAAMKLEVTNAARYERRLTALERRLDLQLKEARDNFALYSEKKTLVKDHIRLAKQENVLNAPMILRANDRTREVVHEVEWKLPRISSQLAEIRTVYNLGRHRAQALQAEMEWKAKSDFQQWHSTLLGKGPLSLQQVKREWYKLLWALVLVASALLFCLYVLWAAVLSG